MFYARFSYSVATNRQRPARVLLNCRANSCPSNCPWDRITTAFFLRLFWRLISFYPLLTVLCRSAAIGSFVTAIRGLVAATASSSLLIVFGFHLHSLLVVPYKRTKIVLHKAFARLVVR